MISDEAGARCWLQGLPEWTAIAAERLERLVSLLVEENTRQNLVSASSLGQVWRRHIADSAQLLVHVPCETHGPWLDLGTGAGFPGLVIAALRPDVRVVMVEARMRRIDWLQRAVAVLELPCARVEGAPLEKVSTFPAAVISARAFAPLDRLLDLSARFSTEATVWLLPKGRSAQQELDGLGRWNHMFHVEQSLTDADAGVIVGRLAGRKGRKGS